MTVTAQEAEALILQSQTDKIVQFYTDNPKYLRAGQTLDSIRQSSLDNGIDWGEDVSQNFVNGYVLEFVESFGGEGMGDHAHVVYSVRPQNSDDMQYFRIDGYYTSYDGTDWDGELYEVKLTTRTVTFYEEKA